ncbi:MAG: hypothetical protein IJE05_00660 [Clostridia bacterium]|nr:hypothetical protein [Clostridia bacterium]
MINNPKDIEEILKELEDITLEELDEAIKNVEKEYMKIDYEYEEIYDMRNEKNYYLSEDYYDFYLHMSKTNRTKENNEIKNSIGVAA